MATYTVKHKNPSHPDTKAGTKWAVDGEGSDWTKAQAQAHAKRCEYQEYEIVEVQPAPSGTRGRRSNSGVSDEPGDES